MTGTLRSAIPASSLALVGAGGAAGAGVRWAVLELSGASGSFPWWTLAVNVLGCLLLGMLLGVSERVRLPAGVGFCGGLTTFSTFSVEVATMLDDGDVGLAAGYLGTSLALGVVAFLAGVRLAPAMR